MPKFTAGRSGRLLDVLREALPEWKTGTLKQRLRSGLVRVNNSPERSGAAAVGKGDALDVEVRPAGSRVSFPKHLGEPPLSILHSDHDLLAVDKPHGLLSVATPRERSLTAIKLMRDWLAGLSAESRDNLHAAHRLDRDASGVLLLARSLAARKKLVAAWKNFDKTYLAVTDGVPERPEGRIDVPLWEDKGLFVRPAERGGGEEALTFYRLLKSVGGRSLLEVRLGTGRKHQIRVHLAHIGCPIVGDIRYGKSKAKRLMLHAANLRLTHPSTGQELTITAPTPRQFATALKKGERDKTGSRERK